MYRAYGSFIKLHHHYRWIKIQRNNIHRAYGSARRENRFQREALFATRSSVRRKIDIKPVPYYRWIKIQRNNMHRAYGSTRRETSPIGTANIVTTDFNPLEKRSNTNK